MVPSFRALCVLNPPVLPLQKDQMSAASQPPQPPRSFWRWAHSGLALVVMLLSASCCWGFTCWGFTGQSSVVPGLRSSLSSGSAWSCSQPQVKPWLPLPSSQGSPNSWLQLFSQVFCFTTNTISFPIELFDCFVFHLGFFLASWNYLNIFLFLCFWMFPCSQNQSILICQWFLIIC